MKWDGSGFFPRRAPNNAKISREKGWRSSGILTFFGDERTASLAPGTDLGKSWRSYLTDTKWRKVAAVNSPTL